MLLIPSAWAYTVFLPCQVQWTSMELDGVDVAVDHVPAALVSGECDGTVIESELLVDGQVVASSSDTFDTAGLVELDVALEPETTYVWEIDTSVISFTTGTELATLSDAPPVAYDLTVTETREHTVVRAAYDVVSPGPWMIEFIDDDGVTWLAGAGLGDVEDARLADQHPIWPDGELCLTPSLRQEDGSRLDGDAVCASDPGCSATGLGASLLPGVLAIGALRRRRRRA